MNNSPQYKQTVGVIQINDPQYPKEAPYHPSLNYKEYPFSGFVSNEANLVYDGVRQLFFKLGFDIEHWNTHEWNPLGNLIRPGMAVVIKPNFVLHKHAKGKDIFSVITHPSILRAIIDYCWIALKGKGKIIIVDSPGSKCNFKELLRVTKLQEIKEFINKFSGPRIEIHDLRNYWIRTRRIPPHIYELPGDTQGNILINLGKKSYFYNHSNQRQLYSTVYHRNETVCHHFGERQEYEMSKTALNADVIISVPKMKIHKKVGVSLNLKGLVGICTNKKFIIHCTLGTPSEGGDQFPEGLLNKYERAIIKFQYWLMDHFFSKRIKRKEFIDFNVRSFLFRDIVRSLRLLVPKEKRLIGSGNWHGNDSVWRTVADLARIIYFVDKDGRLHDKQQRKLFSIIDGVIGGENMGPDVPDPKPVGVLMGGENLLAVDIVATRLMGFNPLKLRQFSVLSDPYYDFGLKSLDEIEVVCDDARVKKCLEDKVDRFFAFRPYPSWIGHIEI